MRNKVTSLNINLPWTVSNGELEMIVNWNAVWGVEITYTSFYILHKRCESTTFRGSRKNDL